MRRWREILSLQSSRLPGRILPGRGSAWLATALLWVAGSPFAAAKYGEILEIKGNSPFPPGWVVIKVADPAFATMSMGPAPKPSVASLTLTIMDARGAAVGTELEVSGNSPIPPGWVLLKTVWPTVMSMGKHTQPDWVAVHTIRCIAPTKAASEE